jgi:AcrR family transcriptional regulator
VGVTTFQRARSDEQREHRRRAILDTAAGMLGEMTVSELSLNELSRRVGLAKSNVLRYFETREAVLLSLYDTAWRAWLDRLILPADPDAGAAPEVGPHARPAPHARPGPHSPAGPPAGDAPHSEAVAAAVAASLVENPLLCELISVSASVLERNVSPDVARRYKLAAIANTARMGATIRAALPGLAADGEFAVAAGTLVAVGGIWPLANPTAAMLCVYEDPEMAAMRIDFATALREMLAVVYAGCLVRWPAR